MEAIGSILERLPQRELEIRRRCARDARFRSICRDFDEAARALRHWQAADMDAAAARAREYEGLLAELETEIVAQLDQWQPRDRQSRGLQ